MRRDLALVILASGLAACTAPLPIFDDAGPRLDAGVDAAAPMDAGADAGHDAGVDAGADAGPTDAGFDAGTDAGTDAGPPPSIVRHAVGSDHSCVLLDTGVVRCWGGDYRGQLGDGATDESFASDRPDPQPVVGLSDVAAIYAGWGATCAIDATDGSARCWGHNSAERFGDGVGSATIPTPEGLFFSSGTSEPIVELDHNGSHLCVRGAMGVFCSGRNGTHQLGRDGANSHLLSAVEGLPFGRAARSVAVGYSGTQGFTLVAFDDGSVWCWGANDDAECAQTPSTEVAVPTMIAGLSRIVQVDAGSDFACALDDAGAVFCWGDNGGGRLGNGVDGGPAVETPTAVAVPAMRRLSVEDGSVLAVTTDGHGVYAWGENDHNLFGLGPAGAGPHPTPLPIRLDATATFEAAHGATHACLLERRAGATDVLLCAGSNRNFQLGMMVASDPMRFTPVPTVP